MMSRKRYVEAGRTIRASCASLWDLLTDTTRWVEWGPSVRAVECEERYIRLGSKGRVRTAFGLWVPFVVTAMDEGQYWSWHVFGVPATGHRVNRLGKDRCRLVFQIPIWAAPYAIVCHMALRRIAQVLSSL
jgi:hypothetical protein